MCIFTCRFQHSRTHGCTKSQSFFVRCRAYQPRLLPVALITHAKVPQGAGSKLVELEVDVPLSAISLGRSDGRARLQQAVSRSRDALHATRVESLPLMLPCMRWLNLHAPGDANGRCRCYARPRARSGVRDEGAAEVACSALRSASARASATLALARRLDLISAQSFSYATGRHRSSTLMVP